MASREDISLMSHLMRRAGFGGARDEIESLCDQGYEETVEELLDPVRKPPVDEYSLYRHHPVTEVPGGAAAPGQANWLYFMATTQRPLEEKIALFWHHVFATGNAKVDNCFHLLDQIALFREHGMGNYRDLLIALAKDPAMIFWLDNNENHKRAPNENWGPRAPRAVLSGRRQLHREGCVRVLARLHRMDHRRQDAQVPLRAAPVEVRLPLGGP